MTLKWRRTLTYGRFRETPYTHSFIYPAGIAMLGDNETKCQRVVRIKRLVPSVNKLFVDGIWTCWRIAQAVRKAGRCLGKAVGPSRGPIWGGVAADPDGRGRRSDGQLANATLVFAWEQAAGRAASVELPSNGAAGRPAPRPSPLGRPERPLPKPRPAAACVGPRRFAGETPLPSRDSHHVVVSLSLPSSSAQRASKRPVVTKNTAKGSGLPKNLVGQSTFDELRHRQSSDSRKLWEREKEGRFGWEGNVSYGSTQRLPVLPSATKRWRRPSEGTRGWCLFLSRNGIRASWPILCVPWRRFVCAVVTIDDR